MKKLFSATILSASIALFACNDNNANDKDSTNDTTHMSTTTTTDHMNDASNNADKMANHDTTHMATGKTVTDKATIDFVTKAAQGGMMEVDMGNMAVQNAQSERVKNFGNMMVTDHTNANNELKSMAMSNNITLPTDMPADAKTNMNMMSSKKGMAWDKAYMDMMVKDHKKDIDEFKKASTSLNEAAYKDFATKTLPVLQKHLDSAMAIQKSL